MATRTILLAHGDDDARRVFRATLEWSDYPVWEAHEPDEAWELARRGDVALAITDFPSRLSDGRALVEAVKADPETAATPVLVVTAHALPDVLARARAMGADEVVTMPVLPSRLVEVVDRMLGRAEMKPPAPAT